MRRTGPTVTVAVLLAAAASCTRPATTAPETTLPVLAPTTEVPTTLAPSTSIAPPPAPTTTEVLPPPPETTPPTTAPPPPPPPAPAPAPPPPAPAPVSDGMLRAGDRGPEVQALQEQLEAQGYWLGGADGVFGPGTTRAVVALQKASGLGRDGVVGPATRGALDRGQRVQPRSTSGHVIEVDLARQIVIVADDGHATYVLDTSTGKEPGSTPADQYRIFRGVNGMDTGPFGPLYRPKYFYNGVAIHGYNSIPTSPASHGCVRVTNAAIDMLWDTDRVPNGTLVWVY
jgi:peptidoglycan hydrolase-like protein with peptidoglycan-binding domain